MKNLALYRLPAGTLSPALDRGRNPLRLETLCRRRDVAGSTLAKAMPPLPLDPMTSMMRTFPTIAAAALAAFSLSPLTTPMISAEELKKPETLTERISYSYGLMIARQLSERGVEIDLNQFTSAFETVLSGGEPALDEDEVSAAFDENQQLLAEKNATGSDRDNLLAGKAFLEEAAKKDGVRTTPSGLQYEILAAGEGRKPSAEDSVTVHYHGTLIDGTVFDSSVDRGTPSSFQLDQVIPGWTEGVQLMPIGSKYRFFIPYYLAYGERGAPGAGIMPYSALTFEVELLEIGE